MLTSCDRLKSAIGIDRIQSGDSVIIHGDDNDDGNTSEDKENPQLIWPQSPAIADIDFKHIGDTLLDVTEGDLNPLLAYTVTAMQVFGQMSALEERNISAEDMNVYSIVFADDGTWWSDAASPGELQELLFVLLDVTVEYIAEPKEDNPDDKNDHLIQDSLLYKSDELKVNGAFRWTITTLPYFSHHSTGKSSQGNYYHYTLALGETMRCQVGWFVEKEIAEQYGLMLQIGRNDGAQYIDLPYDYSEV
jgi:hypothetical protein